MQSMTGFGRAFREFDRRSLGVEIKSVNGRYLDMNIRLPRTLQFLDPVLRSRLKTFVSRGKIDVWVTAESAADAASGLSCNEALASAYMHYARSLAAAHEIPMDMTVRTLMRLPEIFTMENPRQDEEELTGQVMDVFDEACAHLVEARQQEGERIREDLAEKLSALQTSLDRVKERSPLVMDAYRNRLRMKLTESADVVNVDEARLAQELVIYADKVSADEELVRLESHLQAMEQLFFSEGPVGRRLDFLVQELNREVNTMMSKANDLDMTREGVEMKTCIEKIREQIQNME